MVHSARHAGRRQNTHTQNDVRKLPYRRIGKPGLQVILLHSNQRRKQYRAHRNPSQDIRCLAPAADLRPKSITDDSNHAESARLHHCHRVKQCTDRRRRYHGRRQPTVQRHNPGFDDSAHNYQEKGQCRHPFGERMLHKPSWLKIQGATRYVQKHDAGQEQLSAAESIDQVLPAR